MTKRAIIYIVVISLVFMLFGCTEEPQAPAIAITDVFKPEDSAYYTCDYNGVERRFMLHIPEGIEENAPLVFVLHGYSSDSRSIMNSTGMNSVADQYGYAVVYPQGIRDQQYSIGGTGWNSLRTDSGNDDLGYLVSLAHYLQQTYGFNSSHTFAAGFSNGAFMMYKLACEAPDTFRAVASVAGTMREDYWEQKKESASVGILQINGTDDSLIPIESTLADSGVYKGAPTTGMIIEYWKNANNLDIFEEVKLSDRATSYRYSSEKNAHLVWYIEIEGGGHSWPQQETAGFSASEVILEFFSNYVN